MTLLLFVEKQHLPAPNVKLVSARAKCWKGFNNMLGYKEAKTPDGVQVTTQLLAELVWHSNVTVPRSNVRAALHSLLFFVCLSVSLPRAQSPLKSYTCHHAGNFRPLVAHCLAHCLFVYSEKAWDLMAIFTRYSSKFLFFLYFFSSLLLIL